MGQSTLILDPDKKITANPDSTSLVLAPAAGKQLGIKDIREAIRWASRTAFAASDKRLIILQANHLTDEAEQALLKTLEEPTHSTTIVLTCAYLNQLRPTTISRCAIWRLDQLALHQLTSWHLRLSDQPPQGLDNRAEDSITWATWRHLPPIERWVRIQQLTVAPNSLLPLLTRWQAEAKNEAPPPSPAEYPAWLRGREFLERAIAAGTAHAQPKLVLDWLSLQLEQV